MKSNSITKFNSCSINSYTIKVATGITLAWLFLFGGHEAVAQVDLGAVETQVRDATTSIRTIVQYILYACMIIALIHVIYSVATSNPKMKDIIIAWAVALIVLTIGLRLIPA